MKPRCAEGYVFIPVKLFRFLTQIYAVISPGTGVCGFMGAYGGMILLLRSLVLGLVMSLTIGAAQAREPKLDANVPDEVYATLEYFVTDIYLSGHIAKKNLYRHYYAKRLKRYWKKRNVSRREVIADKKRHFRRWPYTRYRLIKDSMKVFRIVGEGDAYALQFDYYYEAERPGRATSGKGRTEMLLRVKNGLPVIYRETGRVLRRR